MKAPKARPCGSCPYRKDVPGGVWAAEEYEKLPEYDQPTHMQPLGAFGCHQQDGHLCAGWVGCHDMEESLAFKFNARFMTKEDIEATLAYESPVELWESGAVAAEHGLASITEPDTRAKTVVRNLIRKGLGNGNDPGDLREGQGQRPAHPQEAPDQPDGSQQDAQA